MKITKTQTKSERLGLLLGGCFFGFLAFLALTSSQSDEGFIFGALCAILAIVGIVSSAKGYDRM